ncbi:MAG: hypothetical protein FWC57_05620, partial [Endomicrobia bacterium]|nr:hypothetical protein [Endomicrobiia bacterium]
DYFLGASVSNLSSGDMAFRDTLYNDSSGASISTWNYMLSGAGIFKPWGIAYGVSLKYFYQDLYVNSGGAPAADIGLSKIFKGPEIFDSVSTVKLGLSAQNIAAGDLTVEEGAEGIPRIYRLSSALVLPVYYRFKTQDTVSVFADLKYEDDFLDIYGGAAYTIADKYAIRAGYYPEHFTFGFGVDFFSFTVDYSADFGLGDVDMIHRFGLTFRWGAKKQDELEKEAKAALAKEKLSLKEAEKRFDEAKKLYNKGEYLRATDMLSVIVVSYPTYESPLYFYKKTIETMNATAASGEELDFGKLTYAKGYCAYYKTDYKEALNEWNKYTHFTGGSDEVNEYMNKINDAMKLAAMQKREAELDQKSAEMLKSGIASYNAKQWVQCIKTMEKLQKFVTDNNFSKTIEYYSAAKEYIGKAVAELSKTIKSEKKEPAKADEAQPATEKREIDEAGADKRYNEGLILYAQGKYLEAERTWELALRMNPNHLKAKIALDKVRKSGNLSE